MSALLQSPNLFRSLRRVSEPEAIMTIAHLALTTVDAASGLEMLASVALRLSGVHGVEINLRDSEALEWHVSKAPAPRGAATGLVTANRREWGRLRILFEPRIKSLECPLRFARFLAQQVALMLNRVESCSQNNAARTALRRLEQRLDTRKAMGRAAGILAQRKNLPYNRAVSLLLQQARESRRPPLALARALILSAETGYFQPITLRRLRPEDLTTRGGF